MIWNCCVSPFYSSLPDSYLQIFDLLEGTPAYVKVKETVILLGSLVM